VAVVRAHIQVAGSRPQIAVLVSAHVDRGRDRRRNEVKGAGSEMTVSSLQPARRLADLAAGWEGLWSLLVTARRAA
jgi:hypothetical protein